MNKTLQFMKLDFLTIRPYVTLKNLLIIVIVGGLVTYANQSAVEVLGAVMGMITMYTTYPFAVGDQNGIDTLYITLGLDKATVVKGRYLWLLMMNGVSLILGFVLSLIFSLVFNFPLDLTQTIFMTMGLLVLFMIVQLIQFPVMFKVGYMKSKTLNYFVLMGVVALIVGAGSFLGKTRILSILVQNVTVFSACLVLLVLGIFLISLSLSIKFYSKRSF